MRKQCIFGEDIGFRKEGYLFLVWEVTWVNTVALKCQSTLGVTKSKHGVTRGLSKNIYPEIKHVHRVQEMDDHRTYG